MNVLAQEIPDTATAAAALTPASDYPHKGEFRNKLVYASDGVIYVNRVHMRDIDVVGEVSEIRRSAGRIVRTHPSTLSEIEEIYASAPHQDQVAVGRLHAATDSDRQQSILDLIKRGREQGASDIHLTERRGGKTLVEFRILGELGVDAEITSDEGRLLIKSLCQSMLDSANSSHFEERSRYQGRLRREFCKNVDVWSGRLASTPTDDGLHAVLRLLYKRRTGRASLADLGFRPEQIAVFDEYLHRGRGMGLFTGPTGSGKSTSLETLISLYIDRTDHRRRVLTMEHPVEFPILGAVQTPIMDHAGMDDDKISAEFAEATSHSLRLDPDLLMLGEIRARSGAAAAFTAAMTGHGLLSTLHVDDWIATFPRLLDLGVPESLAFNPRLLRFISNQALARTLCPHCKVPYLSNKDRVKPEVRARVEKYCEPEHVFLRGDGCEHCARRPGIAGQIIVAEVVRIDRRLMEAYKESPFAAYDYWAKEAGGLSKCQNLITRINEGLIEPTTGEEDVCPLDDDLIMAWH
ncbi:GspE/PulE family protein [Castellaniella sp. UC4442_H9]